MTVTIAADDAHPPTITLTVDDDTDKVFTICVAPEDDTQVALATAVGQQYRYTWHTEKELFQAEDGHDLVGILVRDLMWYCRGMPKF